MISIIDLHYRLLTRVQTDNGEHSPKFTQQVSLEYLSMVLT